MHDTNAYFQTVKVVNSKTRRVNGKEQCVSWSGGEEISTDFAAWG
jgi:hypothetical protein